MQRLEVKIPEMSSSQIWCFESHKISIRFRFWWIHMDVAIREVCILLDICNTQIYPQNCFIFLTHATYVSSLFVIVSFLGAISYLSVSASILL